MARLLNKARGFLANSKFARVNPLNRRKSQNRLEQRRKGQKGEQVGGAGVLMEVTDFITLKYPKPKGARSREGKAIFTDRRGTVEGLHDVSFLKSSPEKRKSDRRANPK